MGPIDSAHIPVSRIPWTWRNRRKCNLAVEMGTPGGPKIELYKTAHSK
jgi:hypothetical protein